MRGRRAIPFLFGSGQPSSTEVSLTTRIVAGDSDDLATLVAEHRALDDRVRKLDKRPYLTSAEQQEIRTLKKMKLAKKDLIATLSERREA
jgi:uncharacterized protein YdcH (DUF465 family)